MHFSFPHRDLVCSAAQRFGGMGVKEGMTKERKWVESFQ